MINYDGEEPVSEINVTPFVDVLLVLLVIFMITAPIVTFNLPIELPKGQIIKSDVPKNEETIVISLFPDNKVFLNDSPVKASELIPNLLRLQSEFDQLTPVVYLQADKSISYGQVADLLAKLSGQGIVNVSLVLEKN